MHLDPTKELARSLGRRNLDLAERVERLATIAGERRDYALLTSVATDVSTVLRAIAERDRDDVMTADAVNRAHDEVGKILDESKAIEKLFPAGPVTFQIRDRGESAAAHRDKLQEWELHGRRIQVAQDRLAEIVEKLQASLVPTGDTPFDRRTRHLVHQVETIIERAKERYLERSKVVLDQSRFLRAHAELDPADWAEWTRPIAMLTGRTNDGTVDPATFFHSNVREYLLGRLENLFEWTKVTPYLLRIIETESSFLPPEAKAKYDPSHDLWSDQYFEDGRTDYARDLNDRLSILGRHQDIYAPGEGAVTPRNVYAHLHELVRRLECVHHHLENIERIVGTLAAHVAAETGLPISTHSTTTVDFRLLAKDEQERLLSWMVSGAAKSAEDQTSADIALRGYFPKLFRHKETFRAVLELGGARLTLARDADEQVRGCAIALNDQVLPGQRPMKERYAEHVRVGIAWWMNIDPDARGTDIYDALNDQMLLDSVGKVDMLVGRLKVGAHPSTHAFKAHLRRLHIPSGGFENLPHGLHLHLVSFVSPSLRKLYFEYMKIDQDYPEVPSVTESQVELGRSLEGKGPTAESGADGTWEIPESAHEKATTRVAKLLLDQSHEPWDHRFDPLGFFDAILFFDGRHGEKPA